jgi:hypothetical protein
VTDEQQPPRPDLEISASWRAGSARRHGDAKVRTLTAGDAKWSEELSEREPDAPEGRRWRLFAWVRDPG